MSMGHPIGKLLSSLQESSFAGSSSVLPMGSCGLHLSVIVTIWAPIEYTVHNLKPSMRPFSQV